jgi:hypothetical protein
MKFRPAPGRRRGLIIFAHGSGGGRFSSRNRQVKPNSWGRDLRRTLLDLLTAQEETIDERRSISSASPWTARERRRLGGDSADVGRHRSAASARAPVQQQR